MSQAGIHSLVGNDGSSRFRALTRNGRRQTAYAASGNKTVLAKKQKGVFMASILAVDDSPSLREMVTYTLEAAGHEVTQAQDGAEALTLARETKYDLVLTDVNMPNMDGITLIRELRALPAYKYVPLLMLTTESGDDKKQQGKAVGATGWLVKPFDPEKLIAVIRKVLG
jgi:two-component system chemotaxis response regulator CheY